jgi:hypothetical protein
MPAQLTRASQTPPQQVVAVQYLTPFELSEHPDRYYGKTVSMIGDVDDAYGTRAFTLNEELPWTNAGDILVLAPELKKEFTQVAYVRVRGLVVRAGSPEVEKYLAEVPAMAARIRDDFKNRPIVLAESVTGPAGDDLTAKGGRWS